MKVEMSPVQVDWTKFLMIMAGLIIGVILAFIFFSSSPDVEVQDEPVPVKVINESGFAKREILLKNPRYQNGDLDVIFEEQDFDERVLDFNLKSHPNVNHIKQVGLGKQVVMYYDVNSVHHLENALGEPEFWDIRTGELVERNWRYVYWGNESYESPVYSEQLSINGTIEYVQTGTETLQREVWKPYNSRDIPKGDIRIGIEVEVKWGDHMDGVWVVGSKKIDKHAQWQASLETDLISWYKLDEISGTNAEDIHGSNNGTASNARVFTSEVEGIINTSADFSGGSDDIDLGTSLVGSTGAFTVNSWIKTPNTDEIGIFSQFASGNPGRLILSLDNSNKVQFQVGSQTIQTTETLDINTWYMVTFVRESDNTASIYINGNSTPSATGTISNNILQVNSYLGSLNGVTYFNENYQDEVGIWSRALSGAEIGILYNSGYGCTYQLCPGVIIDLISPEDNANLTTTTNTFSANVTITGETLGIANVSLLIDGNITQTNSSGVEGIYNFSETLSDGDYNWSVIAYDNESVQYNATETRAFSIYRLFLNSETFDSTVTEGQTSTFSQNLLTNGTDISGAVLIYNETSNAGTISNHGANNFTVSSTITIPSVSQNTNITFNWNITQSPFATQSLRSKNQTILDINIDDCSTNQNVLYNFTIFDEDAPTQKLDGTGDNTRVDLNLQIRTFGTSTQIASFENQYNRTNPFSVCFNSTIPSGNNYNIDLQAQYRADNYQSEFYHIQNETINSTDFNTNISLFDLNSTEAVVFRLIFRDSSFLPIENALIKINRKYIDENVERIIEIPKTDSRGVAVANLVLNEVIYDFKIVKFGVTLAEFDDVIAVCQIPLVQECEIDFNSFSDSIVLPDFEEAQDFSFTLGYDKNTREVSSTFSIPSGTVSSVSLNVTQEDTLGTSVCTDILTSSSGTLTCSVPQSFGNSTLRAKLYKSDTLQAQGSVKLDQDPSDIYGVSLIGLSIFILLTLIGVGVSNNPIVTTLFLMVGVILLFALNLVQNNAFFGATATILWLVIAVIIILIKGVGRN